MKKVFLFVSLVDNILVLNAQIVVTPVNKKVTCCGSPLFNPMIDSITVSPFANSDIYLFSAGGNVVYEGFYLVNKNYYGAVSSKINFSQNSYNYLDIPNNMPYDSIMYGFKKIGELYTDNNWSDSNAVRFFQLKYTIDAATAYYGWLKLRYANYIPFSYGQEKDTIYIESYGMNLKPNEVIRMGQTAPTSVQEIIKKSNINVFPNPVSSIHHIQFENQSLNPFTIDLYSIQGKKIKSIHTNSKDPNIDIQLDIADIPDGLYFYKVIVDKKTETILFNKQ